MINGLVIAAWVMRSASVDTVTVCPPLPPVVTPAAKPKRWKSGVVPDATKLPVTLVLELRVKVSGFALLTTPPVQPVKVAPALGVAVSVTDVPQAKVLPLGVWVTVPGPLAAVVRVQFAVCVAKLAVTLVLAFRVNVRGLALLVTPPVQPVKVDPELAVAVRVIDVPQGKVVPLGLWLIVPDPLTLVVRVQLAVPPADGAKEASECARRLAPECVQLRVVAPAVATAFVLLAPVEPLEAIPQRRVWPLAAVNVPELPLPTASTTHAPLVCVVMLVEMESAPLESTLVATLSGALWFTPKSDTAPTAAPWIEP